MTTRILGWARIEGEPLFCGVVAFEQSVITACSGRWSARLQFVFVQGRDRTVDALGRKMDKCGACDQAARFERTNEGLAELAEIEVEVAIVDLECQHPFEWRIRGDEFSLDRCGICFREVA